MPKNKLYILLFVFPFFLNAGNFVVESLSCDKTTPCPSNPLHSGGEEGFNAVYDGKRVILSWHASSKKSFDVYTVEKSKDGLHYSTALIVKGTGHSAAEAAFTDIDYAPYAGISYYRLKQSDYQGNITYSPIMPVNFKYAKDGSLVPANQQQPDENELLKIQNKEVLVLVRDPGGNEFTTKVKVNKEPDNKLYAVESGNSLGKGSYLVMASSFNALNSQKLIVR